MCKKHKVASDTIITIIDIIIPFFTKSINLNSTSIFFKIDIHIIPASAPIGVRYAPTLEAIIVLYIISLIYALLAFKITSLNNTLIGILFIRFVAKNDVRP